MVRGKMLKALAVVLGVMLLGSVVMAGELLDLVERALEKNHDLPLWSVVY